MPTEEKTAAEWCDYAFELADQASSEKASLDPLLQRMTMIGGLIHAKVSLLSSGIEHVDRLAYRASDPHPTFSQYDSLTLHLQELDKHGYSAKEKILLYRLQIKIAKRIFKTFETTPALAELPTAQDVLQEKVKVTFKD